MLKKIAFTCGSWVITDSASTTPCASPPPPRSQKLAGRPPANVTTSTVDIVSPAPFPSTPTSPSSLHVGDVLLARERLERVGRLAVAHLGDVRVAEERVVVDRELRVERLHLAVGRHDQRVDLAEHRVEADERLVQLPDDRRDLLLLRRVASRRRRRRVAAPATDGTPRAGRRGAGRARRGSPPRPARCRRRPAW